MQNQRDYIPEPGVPVQMSRKTRLYAPDAISSDWHRSSTESDSPRTKAVGQAAQWFDGPLDKASEADWSRAPAADWSRDRSLLTVCARATAVLLQFEHG